MVFTRLNGIATLGPSQGNAAPVAACRPTIWPSVYSALSVSRHTCTAAMGPGIVEEMSRNRRLAVIDVDQRNRVVLHMPGQAYLDRLPRLHPHLYKTS